MRFGDQCGIRRLISTATTVVEVNLLMGTVSLCFMQVAQPLIWANVMISRCLLAAHCEAQFDWPQPIDPPQIQAEWRLSWTAGRALSADAPLPPPANHHRSGWLRTGRHRRPGNTVPRSSSPSQISVAFGSQRSHRASIVTVVLLLPRNQMPIRLLL